MRLDVDLSDTAEYRDGFPHELFARLRAESAVHEHAPVPLEGGVPMPYWSVVRHAEVQQANRDSETFSATDGVRIAKRPEQGGLMLVSMDAPQHTRLRRLVTSGFTPRMISKLEQHITERADSILDDAAARGTCDLVRDIAHLLPMHVIADIVGIPDEERPWVFDRTNTMLRAYDVHASVSAEDQRQAQVELFGYAQELGERKRREPADDVWTILANAEGLEGLELEMFFILLATAGSETTRNAISQGVFELTRHPDQVGALRDDPALVPAAVEEMLRWSSPVLYFARTATRDTELGGVRIPTGARVVYWYASANRDERAFEDPDRFDVHRNPNPHVAFGGGGAHFCIGAHLARKEIQVMTAGLLRRFDVELAGEPVWLESSIVHNVAASIDELPIRLVGRGGDVQY